MNQKANNIKNRLSLRLPQEKSLGILADLADKLSLSKNPDMAAELATVNTLFPTCTDFERNFPSMCFALATGVGKTRLMGAFIAYLYTAKGIKNFFVLAPNITIYDKLIAEFSDTSHPKYVFKGIAEFVTNQPRIITGDNYENAKQATMFNSEVHINVFNISKLNAETRGGKEPRIKRLAECLGESYFSYLSGLPDLVLLMDESHHYRADRGMEVINELNPVLGLELTATPQVERGGKAIKFKNVVYEYSLAKAIRDGFVKEPAVATRRNFDPDQYTPEQLDLIKLQDGINLHEDTKVSLDIYSRDNKTRLVKPFVLVVAKDTKHAAELKKMIESKSFFKGIYADKVMEIHSAQSGEEKDENIAKLLSLESPSNKIEIVIHVNMLKEGWDVTNLYTIIPLRASASVTLTEQTIGRGLRLPFGTRTGDSKADKLTIVAHDKFQKIIDEANKPGSIIKQENIITIEPQEEKAKEVITVVSGMEAQIQQEQEKIDGLQSAVEKKQEQEKLDVKKVIISVLPEVSSEVKNIGDLTREEEAKIVKEKVRQRLESTPQMNMFIRDEMEILDLVYESVVADFRNNIIEIPRIMLTQAGSGTASFRDFDLDVSNLNLAPVSEEILRKTLRTNEDEVISGKGGVEHDTPEKTIINELINHAEIDYDSASGLLFKLSGQAVKKLESYLDNEQVKNVVLYNKKVISDFIYAQMMEHFIYTPAPYEKPQVFAFSRIEEHNYSKFTEDRLHHYTDTIEPAGMIPSKVFTGFLKSCHSKYKFDSKAEKDFAILLENDKDVSKWLRPAKAQFNMWYDNNRSKYEPDFIVETPDTIYMVEVKAENEMESPDTQAKADAGRLFCSMASDFTKISGGKTWKYSLIPHNKVQLNMSASELLKAFFRH